MRVKSGLAEMLKGGVIMDVTTAEQARIAEDAGAVSVMALERVPADIRAQGGVARMADPTKIREIQEAVTIPVMAKARIGHFVEAQILEALEVDYIDESEVLTPADEEHHIDKWKFPVPFVCGCRNLGEALRRVNEGAAMIRTKGEAGTGDIVNAVRHMRAVTGQIAPRLAGGGAVHGGEGAAGAVRAAEVGCRKPAAARGDVHRRWDRHTRRRGPLHAARRRRCLRRIGDLQEREPEVRAKAIVESTTHFRDAEILARVSTGLGEAMRGLSPAAMRPRSSSRPAAGKAPTGRRPGLAGELSRASRDARASRRPRHRGSKALAARRSRRPGRPGR